MLGLDAMAFCLLISLLPIHFFMKQGITLVSCKRVCSHATVPYDDLVQPASQLSSVSPPSHRHFNEGTNVCLLLIAGREVGRGYQEPKARAGIFDRWRMREKTTPTEPGSASTNIGPKPPGSASRDNHDGSKDSSPDSQFSYTNALFAHNPDNEPVYDTPHGMTTRSMTRTPVSARHDLRPHSARSHRHNGNTPGPRTADTFTPSRSSTIEKEHSHQRSLRAGYDTHRGDRIFEFQSSASPGSQTGQVTPPGKAAAAESKSSGEPLPPLPTFETPKSARSDGRVSFRGDRLQIQMTESPPTSPSVDGAKFAGEVLCLRVCEGCKLAALTLGSTNRMAHHFLRALVLFKSLTSVDVVGTNVVVYVFVFVLRFRSSCMPNMSTFFFDSRYQLNRYRTVPAALTIVLFFACEFRSRSRRCAQESGFSYTISGRRCRCIHEHDFTQGSSGRESKHLLLD